MILDRRASGVQLHPTSLPGGRLGEDAHRFVDWLQAAGQSYWQMLPLGPPDEHGSPYKSDSAFAAWAGLLAEPDAPVEDHEVDAFRARAAYWIEDWTRFAGGERALLDQVRFDREWAALRRYALDRDVRLIGDIPIYVAPGSADHLTHPELFQDAFLSGAPPDAYSDLGQFWKNPLYDWPALQRRGYRWWVERFRRVFELFDVARIDHFRGFVAYWSVPADAPDASHGSWRRGPGRAVFDAAARELGELPLIAEDLGVITKPVTALRRALGLPGMLVLQFGFDPDDPRGPHRPANHVRDAVVYTGTHDHDTLMGWWRSLDAGARDEVRREAAARGIDRFDEERPHWPLIGLAFASPAQLAMVQAQDVLGLGSEGRMNVPGQEGGSWTWAMERGALTDELAAELRAVTEAAGRLPS